MSDKDSPPVRSGEPQPSSPPSKPNPADSRRSSETEASRHYTINVSGLHISTLDPNSSHDVPHIAPGWGRQEGFEWHEVERLIWKAIDASKEPQTDPAKIKLAELRYEKEKLSRERVDNAIREIRSLVDAVTPFLTGWKRDLVRRVLLLHHTQDLDLYIDCQKAYTLHLDHKNYIPDAVSAATGRLEAFLVRLGKSRLEDFHFATENEVEQLFRQLIGTTSWEEFDQLCEEAKINYADFHQVLDGVLNGLVTNCFLDVKDRNRLPVFAINANSPGSPVRFAMRFIGADAYIDYRGYIKRISSFESVAGSAKARLHVEGPWRRGEAFISGVLHDIGPIEVAGPRSLTKVAQEMSNKFGPSEKTIRGWRREFRMILSTSDLWFSWRKIHTTCDILRCKGGRMVITTATLTFTRSLGATISKDAGLEASQEEAVSDSSDRELSFDELPAIIGAKVPPESIDGAADDEIARALYVSSSWFSTVGPRAALGHDCAWGNTKIKIKADEPEVVSWLPTTREITMAGWKLMPEVQTPTGRKWGKVQSGCNGYCFEDKEGRIKCHLAPGDCIGPEEQDDLQYCVWGSTQ